MIGDTIGITYNAVAKTLVKVNQDFFGAEYYLDDASNNMRFTIQVKHTIPAKGKFGESHLMKLNVDFLDATSGAIIRSVPVWGVMRTDGNNQDLVSSQRVQAAFLTAYTSGNTTKMLGRES